MSGATGALKNFLTTALRSSRAAWLCGTWALAWGVACLTIIFQAWPSLQLLQVQTGAAAATAATGGAANPPAAPAQAVVALLWWHQTVTLDTGLILLSLLFGILGATAHSLFIITAAVPADDFTWRRLGWFLPQPMLGGILAILLFVVYRAGLLSGQSSSATVDLFGVSAVAGIAGLSANSAYKKLSGTLAGIGNDRRGPSISGVTPATLPKASAAPTSLTVRGTGLSGGTYTLNGQSVTPKSATATRAELPLDAAIAATGTVKISVSVPGSSRTGIWTVHTSK
jgi:hypothetical protein